MRYFLFVLIFLSFHSHYSFALDSPDGGTGCHVRMEGNSIFSAECAEYAAAFAADPNVTNVVNGSFESPFRCNYKAYYCAIPCSAPKVYDPVLKTCSPPSSSSAPSECNGEPKVYDPVTGTMVCPASGENTASSASSSQACVVPGDFNGDCVPDDQQGSSANNSTPASSPDTGSSGSAASNGGGDDGGGGDNGGGGDGDNGGGNNSGGGSASSAASSGSNNSWTPHSGYGNWIPVSENSTCPNKFQDQAGQWWCSGANSNQFGSAASQMAISGECDYTSKSYFTCITSGAGSNTSVPSGGSNSSWTPVSGYGNWIPVEEDSLCPNKFKDAQGKWWCSGGGAGAGSGGAGGSSGSAASGGASGSARSAAGKCDNTSDDYLKCISGQLSSGGSASSASSVNSSSGSSRSGAYSSLGEKGEFDEELHEKKLEDLTKELEDKIADIKEDVAAQVGGTISGSGGIQDFCKSNIYRTEVCFGMKKFESHLDPIANAIFLVCCVLAFVIILRN